MKTSSNNILLSNLIWIRWIAIIGQFFTIFLVYFNFNINIPITECLSIVFVSVIINTYSYFKNKSNDYLSADITFYFLLFDTIQLGFLLYFTGGIYNPFCLLLIAPLIISSFYLPILFSICLLILSIFIVIIISNYFIPIDWQNPFLVPNYFKYGLSISLIISLIFIFVYVYLFANSSRRIEEALSETKQILSKQKQLSSIGSLSAAAVHELSTPLNTILLVLNDLLEEEKIKKNLNIKKEIDLLKSQADRCRNILLTLSKNPENLKDSFFDKMTLSSLVKSSFDKFNDRDIVLKINLNTNLKEPSILLKDELVYGIDNIIQNAIDHANSEVTIDIFWDNKDFWVNISDDGKGFLYETLQEIGKPYISKKEYGMGLGIFIAKNLIENIGGSISFKNNKDSGASVEIKFLYNIS